MKHFCTAGPVKADIHFLIPPLSRLDLDNVLTLIDSQKYFVLHAPRQTGKTSTLNALVYLLNETGRYRALYVNVESAQAARDDYEAGNRIVAGALAHAAHFRLRDDLPEQLLERAAERGPAPLQHLLGEWSERSPLPICLMIDEIDALVGDTLISVLRQLRAGHNDRPAGFPQSIVLCGVRDVRDYRIHGAREIVAGGSAFNIRAESLRLGDFTEAEIRTLYLQHTKDTGQVFEEAVFGLVWELTHGQPWLVNALAYETCFRFEKDRAKPITVELILRAKERLILDRVTHLDQLADKLREPRVQRVIEPLVRSDEAASALEASDDDVQYVIDLGLIRHERGRGLEIANAIYKEVIPRSLNQQMQLAFESRVRSEWYIAPDGRLDMPKLLGAFQQFFRENADSWMERFQYKEAGPQLLLQAFLQRVVNGGGRIDREYALGRGRSDILISWTHPAGVQRVVIELKVIHKTVDSTVAEGLAQTGEYADTVGADESHLVVFDKSPDKSWDEKVFRRDATLPNGRRISVWGM